MFNLSEINLLHRWITPVLLIIDFYEKMAVSSKRRAQMNKVGSCKVILFSFWILNIKPVSA